VRNVSGDRTQPREASLSNFGGFNQIIALITGLKPRIGVRVKLPSESDIKAQ